MPSNQPHVANRPMVAGIPLNVPPKPGQRAGGQVMPTVPPAPGFVPAPAFEGPQQAIGAIFAGGGASGLVAPSTPASEPSKKGGKKKKATAAVTAAPIVKTAAPQVQTAPLAPMHTAQPAPMPADQTQTLPTQYIAPENRPPSTLGQYVAQQNEPAPQFPDIASVFAGHAGVAPISGVVTKAPPPPPPAPIAPPVTYVVEHKLPDNANALIITDDYCRLNVGGQVISFTKGQRITDTSVVQALLRADVPWIQGYQSEVKMIKCPCPCGHEFPLAVS